MRTRSRSDRETIWTGLLLNQDSVDSGAVSSGNIVDATDWQASGTGFSRGATLERIRGSVSLLSGGVASVGGAVWMAIWAVNDDETTPDPSTAADYGENDLLWARVVNFQTVTLTSVGGWSNPATTFDIDVKARRRLTTQSIILMTWRATGGSSDEQAIMSFVLRALVKKK